MTTRKHFSVGIGFGTHITFYQKKDTQNSKYYLSMGEEAHDVVAAPFLTMRVVFFYLHTARKVHTIVRESTYHTYSIFSLYVRRRFTGCQAVISLSV